MAKVEGWMEKAHLQVYDSHFVPAPTTASAPTFQSLMPDPRVLRFFVDVQNKTRLETNMQAAGQLPSQNSMEVRSLRVVVSDLPPQKEDSKPDKPKPLVAGAEFITRLIYSSVTTLLVGEKVMAEMPTFGFPSGAGVFSGFPGVASTGTPSPLDVFRFAEPVTIVPQQNFRVEMQFPRDVPALVGNATGPLHVWVVLDGYMVRDVQ